MKRTLSGFAQACGGRLTGADGAYTDVVSDSRTLEPGQLFVALWGPTFNGNDFVGAARERGAAGAVVEAVQGVPVPQIVVSDTQVALARAAASWREDFSGRLVGVAGSNGKTTAKEMTAAILGEAGKCLATRGNLNNHIGVPLTLLRLTGAHRFAVVEMGAEPRRRRRGAGEDRAPGDRCDHQRGRGASGGLRQPRRRRAGGRRDGSGPRSERDRRPQRRRPVRRPVALADQRARGQLRGARAGGFPRQRRAYRGGRQRLQHQLHAAHPGGQRRHPPRTRRRPQCRQRTGGRRGGRQCRREPRAHRVRARRGARGPGAAAVQTGGQRRLAHR